jgi:hypothetical protein
MSHDPFQVPDIFRIPLGSLWSSDSLWSVDPSLDPIETFSTNSAHDGSTSESVPPGFLPRQQSGMVPGEQDLRIQEVVSPLFSQQEITPEVEEPTDWCEAFRVDECGGMNSLPLFEQTPEVGLDAPLASQFPMPFMPRMEGVVSVPFYPFHARIWTVSTAFPPFWTRIITPLFPLPSPFPIVPASPSEEVHEKK